MKTAFKTLIAGIVLAAVGVGGWFAWKAQSGDSLANISAISGSKLSEEQVQEVITRVSAYMVVPSEESPSVTVLTDVATRAQQQPFFRGAKDGDILIVYSSRAIIYDPKTDKLVNVGPIVQNTSSPAPLASGSAGSPSPSVLISASPVAPEMVKIDVLNGTATAGLAGAMASDLKKNTWVTTGRLGDAQGTYKQTVLVDLSKGKKPGAIAELERILGIKAVTILPSGEQASTADVVVIIGK